MRFYVNDFSADALAPGDRVPGCSYIGLFDGNKWKGEGSLCGWYGVEFYLDVTLLAYGVQKRGRSKSYDPKAPFDGGFVAGLGSHYDRIVIGSGYYERPFEAASIEEAIEIFKKQAW